MILRFTIDGPPCAWARPRVSRRGGFYTQAKQASYANVVASLALAARPLGWSLDGPMKVTVIACFKRGPACKKAGHDGYHPTSLRHDADNLLKLVLDGCNGVVYEDDGQVAEVDLVKMCSAVVPPHTVVAVFRLDDET